MSNTESSPTLFAFEYGEVICLTTNNYSSLDCPLGEVRSFSWTVIRRWLFDFLSVSSLKLGGRQVAQR